MGINSITTVPNYRIYGKYTRHTEIIDGKNYDVICFKNGITVKVAEQTGHAILRANNNPNKPKLTCRNLNNSIITGSDTSDIIKLYNCGNDRIDLLNDSTAADQLYIDNKIKSDGIRLNAGQGDQVKIKMYDSFGSFMRATINTAKQE